MNSQLRPENIYLEEQVDSPADSPGLHEFRMRGDRRFQCVKCGAMMADNVPNCLGRTLGGR